MLAKALHATNNQRSARWSLSIEMRLGAFAAGATLALVSIELADVTARSPSQSLTDIEQRHSGERRGRFSRMMGPTSS
jgi:hypothetical protein